MAGRARPVGELYHGGGGLTRTAYAITLRLDDAIAARVEEIRRALDASAIRSAYPPHLTLAVYQDDVATDTLLAALPGLAAEWEAVPISLVGYGIFPAGAVVWAVPVVTNTLLDRHAQLHAALPCLPCHSDYRPGAWIPHITLAEGGHPSPAEALRALLPLWTAPIVGRADRLELVRFHPANVLWSRALG